MSKTPNGSILKSDLDQTHLNAINIGSKVPCEKRPKDYWTKWQLVYNRDGKPLKRARSRCLKNYCYRGKYAVPRDQDGYCRSRSRPAAKSRAKSANSKVKPAKASNAPRSYNTRSSARST